MYDTSIEQIRTHYVIYYPRKKDKSKDSGNTWIRAYFFFSFFLF